MHYQDAARLLTNPTTPCYFGFAFTFPWKAPSVYINIPLAHFCVASPDSNVGASPSPISVHTA